MADHVLFWDFHGTLTEPDSLWSRSLHRAALAVLPGCGLSFADVRACLDNEGFPWHHPERDYRELTEPEAWWAYVNRLFYTTLDRCGFSPEQASRIVPLVRPQLTDPAYFRLISGAADVLGDLQQGGWQHVMLSNNFPELPELCNALGIGRYFAHYVVSASVGYEKPRREIFAAAYELAGRPDVCYMVGDNPVADIAGAQAAGIPGILVNVPYPEDGPAAAPVHRCETLAALRDLLLG
jgi:putative hydrolase of the HAD superfamily